MGNRNDIQPVNKGSVDMDGNIVEGGRVRSLGLFNHMVVIVAWQERTMPS